MPVIMQKQWEIKMNDNKNWYKLVFKQIQPIHVGAGSYGVISETRVFIPGWTMWGALTNIYGLKKSWEKSDWENETNQKIFQNISCFWPCFDENGEKVLFPYYKDGKFYLGNYPEEEFRAMFVDTFVSTAIIPDSRMAKDKSLHEVDVILPGAKFDFIEDQEEKEKTKQLYWVGVVQIENNNENNDFIKKELIISIGGDSRYGLGKMELVKVDKLQNDKELTKFKNANYVKISFEKENNGEGIIINKKKFDSPVELIVEAVGYKGKDLEIEDNGFFYYLNVDLNKSDLDGLKLSKGKLIKNSEIEN